MTDPVLYDVEDGIATITLNRPEKRNPISERDMVDAIVAALERTGGDPAVRVAILTGAGRAFSSGGDLNAMRDSAGRACPRP